MPLLTWTLRLRNGDLEFSRFTSEHSRSLGAVSKNYNMNATLLALIHSFNPDASALVDGASRLLKPLSGCIDIDYRSTRRSVNIPSISS